MLHWEAPNNDGGSKIHGYSVTMRESNSNWCQLAWVNGETKHFTVEKLHFNQPYRFGVAAENIVGRGPCVEVQCDVYLQNGAGIYL